jgi:alpha-tubulin suppressor-like RCC1 family protein
MWRSIWRVFALALPALLSWSATGQVPLTNIKQISVNGPSCALNESGEVFCWGGGPIATGAFRNQAMLLAKKVSKDSYNSIATGGGVVCGLNSVLWCWRPFDPSNASTPQQIGPFDSQIVDYRVGYGHACVLTAAGSVFCFGANDRWQLGAQSPAESQTPLKVSLPMRATKIAANGSSSCALLEDKSVSCWGESFITETPQLPAVVESLSVVKDVSVGNRFACALLERNAIRCWGRNEYGYLGIGDRDYRASLPTTDVVGLKSGVIASVISASSHSCAIYADDSYLCWGDDGHGALGQRTRDRVWQAVASQYPPEPMRKLAAGYSRTCGITLANEVRCWGYNFQGDLGRPYADANLVAITRGRVLSPVKKLSVAAEAACILFDNQSVDCWGSNDVFEFGSQDFDMLHLTRRIDGLPAGIIDIAVADEDTCAVHGPEGRLSCWNGFPSQQPSLKTPLGDKTGFTQVAGRRRSFCAVNNNQANCWGRDIGGVLSVTGRAVAAFPGFEPAGSAPAGSAPVGCVIALDGVVRCWRRSDRKYVQGSYQVETTEVPGLPRDIISIEFTDAVACALSRSRGVFCWQDFVDSRTRMFYPAFEVKLFGRSAKALSAGLKHLCLTLDDDRVVCAGSNGSGQLGNGNRTRDAVNWPFDFVSNVYGVANSSAIQATGGWQSCAVDGTALKCWGRSAHNDPWRYPFPEPVLTYSSATKRLDASVTKSTHFHDDPIEATATLKTTEGASTTAAARITVDFAVDNSLQALSGDNRCVIEVGQSSCSVKGLYVETPDMAYELLALPNGAELVAPSKTERVTVIQRPQWVSTATSPAKIYRFGDSITIAAAFNMANMVVTGAPTISLTLDSGVVRAQFLQVTGAAKNVLEFEYKPKYGDTAKQRISVSTKIDLNGGAIRNEAGTDAILEETFAVFEGEGIIVDTSEADEDSDGIPNAVEARLGTNPAIKDNDVFGSARLFVMQLYRDFLMRQGDDAGIAYWEAELTAGRQTRVSLASLFINSPEFQSKVGTWLRFSIGGAKSMTPPSTDVTTLKELVLEVDANGAAKPFVQRYIQATDQYGMFRNLQTLGGGVAAIYLDSLGREGTAEEIAAGKRLPIGEFVRWLLDSPEYKRKTATRVAVAMSYLAFLRRPAEAAGYAYWVEEAEKPGALDRLVESFIQSREYRSRFLP